MRPVPNQFPCQDPGAVRLALCGESPGADEVASGRPFSGPSGWLLDQWLASAGLSRAQVFVGNVAQVRPGPNSNDFHLLDWNGEAVQAGISALRADLARFAPNCVLALGNAALHLLRHGNTAPPKSKLRQLFQWTSHVGTWRGSLFLGARDFEWSMSQALRIEEKRRGLADNDLCSRQPVVTKDAGGVCLDQAHEKRLATEPVEPRPLAPFSAGNGVQDPLEGVGRATDNACIPPSSLPAAFSVTQTFKQTSLINTVHQLGKEHLGKLGWPVEDVRNVAPPALKCLSTYHPAATFRDPSFTYPLVSDLKRAVAEARTPTLTLPSRRITWGHPTEELEDRCAAIRAARLPVGFDIEGGLKGLQCCSFATTPNDAFVIDLMAVNGDGPAIYRALASVLEDERVPKVCWNAAYERAVLQAVASITMRGYEDGMLAWWERFSELPKGLDFVASLLTREPYWAEGIGWDRKTGAPKVSGPPFWRYNGIDSCVTLEIWQHPTIAAVAAARQPVPFEIA